MPGRLLAHDAVARKFALGIALTGLMLAFMAASMLVFPYKATANPEIQGELLYDLLGHLEYDDHGRFAPVDDPYMQQRLQTLMLESRLNILPASAYIINQATGQMVWSVNANSPRFDSVDVALGYAMQFITTPGHQLAVQNFWLRDDADARIEFRMVVALPIH